VSFSRLPKWAIINGGTKYDAQATDPPTANAFLLYEVPDVDALYHGLCEKGVAIKQEPTDHPWGHRDLKLSDPNGITISVFSKIDRG
jgi:uncharacterized glyoxalase superfamily protein PhnB